MLTPGIMLQGRYRIVGELGRGGMGAVYEAVDTQLGRHVALKETLAPPGELRRAFEREAKILANLRHDSLPQVLDHFSKEGGKFLVMEYVSGPDLDQVANSGPVPLARALRWADGLFGVLEYLHAHEPPVVHRDIKPSNLKALPSGRLVLLDFGLAKGATAFTRSSHSVTKSVIGYSPYYAPPEQIHGDRTGPKSDLYSAAATLYHLLTGVRPADSMQRTSALLAEEDEPPPARAGRQRRSSRTRLRRARAHSLAEGPRTTRQRRGG